MRHTPTVIRCFVAIGVMLAGVYVASWYFARGGIHYFSPQSLETYSQSEIILPFTRIPIYRSAKRTYRYDLVEHLIDNRYWAPTSEETSLMLTSRWNEQWRDGQSDIHRQFGSQAEFWIDWTDKHPEVANKLWPIVLRILRSDLEHADSFAMEFMLCARYCETIAQFDQCVAAKREIDERVIQRSCDPLAI